ncbi:MAG: hypothetical protein CM15mP106_2490 [Candidatus Neomarinimicrobiota bacterium]|nr:MAG: hypothetical protein CM15mP106_2490 [Candidatus Neomarinimicrobiota bacterium]
MDGLETLTPLSLYLSNGDFPKLRVFIEGPYRAKSKGFSWFKGNKGDGGEYENLLIF